jgi:high-affinity Fe2+/Pb2+ permease
MPSLQDETKEESIVAAFPDHERAGAAVRALERAGIPPDRIGVVVGNVRQAREAAGSFSPAGAVVGAVLGALVAVLFVLAGGETMRQNVVAIFLGAPALIIAFAAIGALAGRAKLFRRREYEHFERDVEMGEVLVSVSGEHRDIARVRVLLKDVGAIETRREETSETL